jgi:hypothetical protein
MMIFAPFEIISVNSLIFLTIVFLIILFGISGVFDYQFGVRVYVITSWILTIFLAVQIVLFYLFRIPLDLKIPILQLSEIYERAFNYLNFSSGVTGYVRFSSLFSEPAHYAHYVLPFLCMKLLGYQNLVRKNFIHAVIITIFIIISASGNGIVTASIIWATYFLIKGKRNLITKAAYILIGAIAFFVIYQILLNFTFFSETVSRLFLSSGNAASKADYRIYRGFAVWFDTPLIYQIFGAGYKNGEALINYFSIFTKYDISGVNLEYFNVISQILIYSGVIGIFLYALMFYKFYKQNDICGKLMVVVLLSLCFSSSIFMETTWLLYLVLIYAGIINNKNNKLNTQNKIYNKSINLDTD